MSVFRTDSLNSISQREQCILPAVFGRNFVEHIHEFAGLEVGEWRDKMKAFLLWSVVFSVIFLLSIDPLKAVEGEKFLDRSLYDFETIDGLKIAYQKVGDGPEVLILIHGFMGNSTNFEYLFDLLRNDLTLIAVDLPGFGLSEKNIKKPLSRRYMAQTVAKLAEKLNLDHYHVLGHSMGSEVAMWLALDDPARVKSLILLDSPICLSERNSIPNNIFTKVGLRLIFMNYNFQKKVFKDMLINEQNFDEKYFLKNYYLAYQTPMEVIFNLAENQDTPQLRENIGKISVPTFIIWGEKDEVTPLKSAECLLSAVKAKLLVIPDAGHLPMIDQPHAVARAIEGIIFSSISNRP